MTEIKLKDYFLKQITNGQLKISVSEGEARYKMSRGSFKTGDKKSDVHKLRYKAKIENRYIFSNGKVSLELTVDDNLLFNFNIDDKKYNRINITFKTFKDEKIYGCGEQYSTLDLKGEAVPIWVSEHQRRMHIADKLLRMKLMGNNYTKIIERYKRHQTYASFPLFTSSENYGMYCECDAYGKIYFKKTSVTLHFRDIPKSLKIICANSAKELVQKVSDLVGRSPKVPDWVNDGAILAVQGGIEVVKKKYEEAKANGVKIAGIWSQDWCGNVVTSFGYQVYWNWSLDNELYSGLVDFIKELNKDGVRFLGYINTFLKEDAPLYNEAKEKDYLVKKQDGKVYHIKSTTFDAGIVDLTNPNAFEWYKNIIKNNMLSIGLSGFMADFGEYLPTDSVIYGGNADEMHNEWPTLWAKCCREAIDECGKGDEVFIFSRAAFVDTVKYTNSIWNGDQHVDFSPDHGLGSVIPASLSLSTSGCGVVHSDIGGYTTVLWMKRDEELLLRWSEMNIFTPIFRTHEGNRPQDNIQFDNENVIKEFARNSNIFYDLKPYRVQTEKEYQISGTPMIRPLFFQYNDERSYTEKAEFLFGSEILVSPVIKKGETLHEVFLPNEKWIQFFTDREYNSGTYDVSAPIGLPIAFYRADSKYIELFKEISNKYKGDII